MTPNEKLFYRLAMALCVFMGLVGLVHMIASLANLLLRLGWI